MRVQNADVKDFSDLNIGPDLREQLRINSEKCIRCKLCQKECAFLRKYGKPKDIADSYEPAEKLYQDMPFECSLCQLCAAVCPVKINPALMFLEMRREAVKGGNGDYAEHIAIRGYERRGTSKRYSYYAIPQDCDTILFPGCALSGTRPDRVVELFDHLKNTIPSLGIVLDCCTKPSHDLGRQEYFNAMFHEMKDFLIRSGIRNVIVACPSCYEVFSEYGGDLAVKTAYEFMAENGLPAGSTSNGTVTIHDSCAVRFRESVHAAAMDLVIKKGLTVEEMKHSGKRTLCCGEGGSVGFLAPGLSKNWAVIRKKEAEGRRIVTYCAGCANFLGSLTPASHILDIIFEPEATMTGTVKISKAPFTYMNRLRLKKHLKKNIDAAITRERMFTAEKQPPKGGLIKRIVFLFLLFPQYLRHVS
jgi:Fe-S oxidoreductase